MPKPYTSRAECYGTIMLTVNGYEFRTVLNLTNTNKLDGGIRFTVDRNTPSSTSVRMYNRLFQ